ncbi:glycosyltransferase family 2 protein [Patescibacteria group bacterium AH-259-L05]|nr:glycosyltransferase family 2 protein [Patescibacteria group bacterium AH-259-L05]
MFNKKNLPNVSVIILTFNGSKYIRNLLKSLEDQSYPREKYEIIVVDNASTDNTISITKEFKKVRYMVLYSNVGFAAGNNHAIKHAKYKYLAFLNQDIICHQHWLKNLVQKIIGHDNIGACTSNMLMPETKEFKTMDRSSFLNCLYYYSLSIFGYGKYYKNKNKKILYPKILSGGAFIITKKTIKKLGYLFDEQFKMYVEDTDLSMRLHNLGLKICAVRDSIIFHLHYSNPKFNLFHLKIAAKAIMNRVFAFYKNMTNIEFVIFFPMLFVGNLFKIVELRIPFIQKLLLSIPLAFFSMICMIIALFYLPLYSKKRCIVLKNRKVQKFYILKLVLMRNV